MNNRDYKEFAEGAYYHFYNRGNGKQDVFLDEADFRFFLVRLKENVTGQFVTAPKPGDYMRHLLPTGAFSILCYCLMPNHFHLLCRQNTSLPLSKLMHQVCTSYSKYFNKKYGHVGHLFQDQFKAVRITDDAHLLWVSAYIHQNPKVASLVNELAEYRWSSYPDYIHKRNGATVCETELVLSHFSNPVDYQAYVENAYDLVRTRKDIEYTLLDE